MVEDFPEIDALSIARRLAVDLDLPPPGKLIDEGHEAYVFETTDPLWVVRVGKMDVMSKEPFLLDEDFASGVTEVRAMRFEDDVVVTWKERVDLFVEGFIARNLPGEKAYKIACALLGLYHCTPEQLKMLKKWKSTRGLAEAIEAGMPTSDLDLRHNLGVTRDGRIVAYDL